MALTPATFTHPVGRLRADMLPGEDLAAALTGWITEAEARAADEVDDEDVREAAATAWVYHRAFLAVYDRLSTLPESARVDEKGQLKWSQRQIDGFLARANEYADAYAAYAADDAAPATPLRPASVVVTASPRWF